MAKGFGILQDTHHQCLRNSEKQRVLMTTGALGEPNEPPIRNPRAGVRHVREAENPLISKGLRVGGVGEC